MKVRFFGSPECHGCLKAFVLINRANIDYDYIDVTDENNDIQMFCDYHKVDEFYK